MRGAFRVEERVIISEKVAWLRDLRDLLDDLLRRFGQVLAVQGPPAGAKRATERTSLRTQNQAPPSTGEAVSLSVACDQRAIGGEKAMRYCALSGAWAAGSAVEERRAQSVRARDGSALLLCLCDPQPSNVAVRQPSPAAAQLTTTHRNRPTRAGFGATSVRSSFIFLFFARLHRVKNYVFRKTHERRTVHSSPSR